MNKEMIMKNKSLSIVIFLFLAMTACQGEIEYQTENHTFGLEGAEMVQADIEMRSGDITIEGGSGQELLVAEFLYNVEKEPPEVNYIVDDSQGDLTIEGSDTGGISLSFKGQDNIWDLAFNEDVPLDLAVSVSDADLDLLLSSLSLTKLETVNNSGTIMADLSGDQPQLTAVDIKKANGGRVEMDLSGRYESLSTIDAELNGARLLLDLTGEWLRDVDINIDGGSGNKVTLKLPQDANLTVNVDSETNEVSPVDFQVDGNVYRHVTGEADAVDLNIQITFDRGQVTLELAQ